MIFLRRLGLAFAALGAFIFGVLLFASDSEAASYSWSGACYGDTVSALAAFQSQFPLVSNGTIYKLTASSISPAGLVTYTVNHRSLTNSNWLVDPSADVQLQDCTSGLVANGRVEYMLTIFAVLACFLFGFSVGKGQFENRFYGERA